MGQDAEVTEELDTEETTPETDELEAEETTEEGKEETVEGEEEKKDEKSEGIEIVRETKESQPLKKQTGFQKRVNKLNQRNADTSNERDSANADNAILQQQLDITKIALEQARADKTVPDVEPNPEDFDDGVYDLKYQKKVREYDKAVIKQELSAQMAEVSKQNVQTQTTTTQSVELQGKQQKHYDRAEKLGATDYEVIEDVAIEKLGLENVNHIIGNFDDSQNILYYLGKNPEEAQALSDLIKSNPIQGVAEIGRLRSEIKIKPKSKTIVPNPDEELEGSVPRKSGKRGPKGATYS